MNQSDWSVMSMISEFTKGQVNFEFLNKSLKSEIKFYVKLYWFIKIIKNEIWCNFFVYLYIMDGNIRVDRSHLCRHS